jgi:hypothetical protein
MVGAIGVSRRWLVTAGLLLALGAVAEARAEDPWETGGTNGDDSWLSFNTLSHGIVQQHDLDEAGIGDDQDWMVVPTLYLHSYEARISGTNVEFDWGTCGPCSQFERVDANGNILTEDVGVVNDGTGATEESNDRSVRWIAANDTTDQYVRVTGGAATTQGPGDVYTIRFWDTTYSVPRWNNSSGQITVFLIQNLVQVPVVVDIDFYDGTGQQLLTVGPQIPRKGLYILNTASLPQLANKGGHAYVSHTAGYGGLAGKAVAVEPATGFSFDTPLIPIPD